MLYEHIRYIYKVFSVFTSSHLHCWGLTSYHHTELDLFKMHTFDNGEVLPREAKRTIWKKLTWQIGSDESSVFLDLLASYSFSIYCKQMLWNMRSWWKPPVETILKTQRRDVLEWSDLLTSKEWKITWMINIQNPTWHLWWVHTSLSHENTVNKLDLHIHMYSKQHRQTVVVFLAQSYPGALIPAYNNICV